MAEELGETITLRGEVEADLSEDLIASLHAVIGAEAELAQFRSDLVRILTRYELYRETTNTTPKKERRAQLTKLRDKASQLIEAMDALAPDVTRALDTNLAAVTEERRWEGWSLDSDEPVPNDDQSVADAQRAAENIITACQMELDLFAETKGAKKGSANPALDQLLSDLAELYEIETGSAAKSQCYRDETAADEFNGKFFHMAQAILDDYAPESFSTPVALGRRIQRVLAED
ncbi:hypothetical protein HCZ23_08385 [Celeribacter sp. HF31]|uniref:hypothetical protein n=1 Tax=Celeribacter sp. HF31 TaxID=2721558 RepID=UPI001430041E|nr:hypothetical protein [Celeribacter sp. HF31]NIY79488.1 hypothetical protein [Celeribacter sp. HF31]